MKRSEFANNERSLVFIGFMGVGKTTVAKRVAKKLYRDFIDIDAEIGNEYNMRTTEIFEKYGEKVFREKEKEYVCHHVKQPLKVISLGGGAFLQEEIKQVCLDNAIVFFLDISWESWKKRLHILIDTRPVLQNKSMKEIEALFNERKSIYADHHSKIITDDINQDTIADLVLDTLKLS